MLQSGLTLPNTLALPSAAEWGVAVQSIVQLQQLVARSRAEGLPFRIIGSGSNVLLARRVAGVVGLMRVKGVREIPATLSGTRSFEVGAGESWQGFVRFCLGQGMGGGVENLSLIPGTVGAAPIQNIGAYGVEVAEFIDAVQVLDTNEHNAEPYWLSRDDCAFGYRDSRFRRSPGTQIVTQVRFRVAQAELALGTTRIDYPGVAEALARMGVERPTPVAVAEAVSRIRRAKLPDPRVYPNAGSFFKNPVLAADRFAALRAEHAELETIPRWSQGDGEKLAAAALIERSGWKSKPAAQLCVWRKQPLVLVNRGGADGAAVAAYAAAIRDDVQRQFGLTLQQEPISIS